MTGLLFRRLFLYTRITYLFPSGLYFVRPQAESSRFILRLLCSTAFEAESDLIGRERPHVTLHDVNGVLRVRHAAVLLSVCLSVCLSHCGVLQAMDQRPSEPWNGTDGYTRRRHDTKLDLSSSPDNCCQISSVHQSSLQIRFPHLGQLIRSYSEKDAITSVHALCLQLCYIQQGPRINFVRQHTKNTKVTTQLNLTMNGSFVA